jgi:hypothetical protein
MIYTDSALLRLLAYVPVEFIVSHLLPEASALEDAESTKMRRRNTDHQKLFGFVKYGCKNNIFGVVLHEAKDRAHIVVPRNRDVA